VLSADGKQRVAATVRGAIDDSSTVGRELAHELVDRGAVKLIGGE